MIRRASTIVLLVILLTSCDLQSQTDADRDWANQHFGHVLDQLMPMRRDVGTYVVYRAHRDFHTEVPEYWFLIGHDANEQGYGLQAILSAHVRAADAVSIYDQLMRVHRADHQEDVASMTKKIKLKKWDFDETNCSAIKDQTKKVEELETRLPSVDPKIVIIHPMIHEFHFQADMADIDMVLWDDDHPLVKWALDTRQALESCAERK